MQDFRSIAPVAAVGSLTSGAVVAGYRLLRQIAGPAETVTWLVHAPRARETLCLTVQPETGALTRRVMAHCRIRSPHVLALVDLATHADGRIIVVSERTDWTLATLLASRSYLSAGEAVTVLAPLASGLAAIHDAGLHHGELTPAAVVFCPDGRPVLGGIGILPNAPEDNQNDDRPPPGVIADYVSLGSLVASVAHVVDEVARPGFLAVADWISERLRDDSDFASLLAQVECRLFALAPALPVVLMAEGRSSADAGRRPERTVAFSADSPLNSGLAPPRLSRAINAVRASGVSAWILRVFRGRALAVCVGIVVLVAAVLAGLAAMPDRTPASRPWATPQSPGPAPGAPLAAHPTATTPPTVDAVLDDHDAVNGEDPVAAVVHLLRLRARCVDTTSSTCVAGYAESDSALEDADNHPIGGSRVDGLLLPGNSPAPAVELVQGYGNAVLLRASPADERRQPVLVLAVRTDTGWRLRDLFEPD